MTTPEDRILWESDEEALYRTARGQEDTLRAEQVESGTTNAGEVQGAREARYAEAIYSQAQFHTNWRDMTQGARNFWIDVAARGILPLVDAEVAAAVSEAQAEVAAIQYERDVACTSIQMDRVAEKRRAESAEAEVERLRAVGSELLRTKDEYRTDVERLRELARVGIELDNHHNAALCPYCTPSRSGQPVSPPDGGRALLAPSPAATTGEVAAVRCDQCGGLPGECTNQDTGEWWGSCYKPGQVPCPTCSGPTRETVGMVCQTCGTDYAPAPVSSGEAEPLNLTDQMQGSSGEGTVPRDHR